MQTHHHFCSQCGKALPATDAFCPACGAQQALAGQPATPTPPSVASTEATRPDQPYNESPAPGLGPSTKLYFQDLFHINKRLGRADYWWGTLGIFLLNFPLSVAFSFFLNSLSSDYTGQSVIAPMVILLLFATYYLVMSIAAITAMVRRLHDIGMSGLCWLLYLVPFLGALILFGLACQPSKQRYNRFL